MAQSTASEQRSRRNIVQPRGLSETWGPFWYVPLGFYHPCWIKVHGSLPVVKCGPSTDTETAVLPEKTFTKPSLRDKTLKMTGRGGGRGKVLLPPINLIFKLLQNHATVSIWLYEQLAIRIEGKIRVRAFH
jgi:hypothetical protein